MFLVGVVVEEQLGDEEAGLSVCSCDAYVARCWGHGGELTEAAVQVVLRSEYLGSKKEEKSVQDLLLR